MLVGFSFVVLGLVAPGQDHPVVAPVRVSSGTMAGQLLKRKDTIMTSWEQEAFAASHGPSSVVTHVIIGETGHVEEVTLVSGAPGLSDAAMRAFREWVYQPYLLNGVPTRVSTTLTVHMNFGGGFHSASDEAIGVSLPLSSPPDEFCDGPWAAKAESVRVSSGMLEGLLITRINPVFPPEAREAHVSGSTVAKICIGRDGRVKKILPISGPQMLRKAVTDAVSGWVYRPYLVDGKPVPVFTTITVQMHGGGG